MAKVLKLNGDEVVDKKVKVDIKQTDTLACELCNCKIWDSAQIVKRVSALVSPTGQETLVPLPMLVCKNCGDIPELLLKQAGLTKEDIT